jgi:hypothetical protein
LIKQTLREWLRAWTTVRPIISHIPLVGIHDVKAIEHGRTWLFDLQDYRVQSISGGVIWLAPLCAAIPELGTLPGDIKQ